MKKASLQKLIASGFLMLASIGSSTAYAQETSLPIVCPGYEPGKSSIPGERVGIKIQKAFEAYSNEMVVEAIAQLREIKAKDPFDRAYTDRFLGNLLAGQEDKGLEALDVLIRAAEPNVLNDADQASVLRLVADLSLQNKKFEQAATWYQKWIDYTCKQDPQIYIRMANAFYELKQYDKVIAPANKAIEVSDKPEKNAYVMKMTSYYERKMYKEAVNVVETMVQVFPDDDNWWSQLGFLYMLVEDHDKALSTFEICEHRGFLTKKNQVRALAQLYSLKDIPFKAAVIQEKYIESGLLEANAKNYASLANSWQQSRDYLKAAKYYGIAGEKSKDPEHYRRQGILFLNAEEYKKSSIALQKALDLGVEKEGAVLIALMEANYYQGKFKKALEYNLLAQKDKSSRKNAKAWEAFIREKAKNRGITI